ncbi:hypothetical protein LTR17_007532 [Elasticomyces elasticus]|nr:hypothetical protein LTR17_007532 [Elasticomyces elasticus]
MAHPPLPRVVLGVSTVDRTKPNRDAPTNLANLPTEMLEGICMHLMHTSRRTPVISLMALRLVCRAINEKTADFFGKAAFQDLSVSLSYTSLQRLRAISKCNKVAPSVQSINISTTDKACNGYGQYELYREDVVSEILPQAERDYAQDMITRTHFEQEDKAFVETSALDGILLTSAFKDLPNLRKLGIPSIDVRHSASVRRVVTGKAASATHIWLMVLVCLAHAGSNPKEFDTHMSGHDCREGVDVQALSIPPDIAQCMHGLNHLCLWLQISGDHYRNPITWRHSLAKLLTTTQQLSVLKLGFRNDFAETPVIFANVVSRVRLPRLQILHLNHMRCDGADLLTFLHNHTGLVDIAFMRLDLTGTVTLSEVLQVLELEHPKLTGFTCNNIAQRGFRLHFETLGELFISVDWASARPDEIADQQLLNTFVEVIGPYKYVGKAEEWEGVQYKIGLLREDLQIADTMYHPFWPTTGHMWNLQV